MNSIDKVMVRSVGRYNWEKMKFKANGMMKKIKWIYNHQEDIGVDPKTIRKIIRVLVKFPKILTLNNFGLLCFIIEYLI